MGPYASRVMEASGNATRVPGLIHPPTVSRRKVAPSHEAVTWTDRKFKSTCTPAPRERAPWSLQHQREGAGRHGTGGAGGRWKRPVEFSILESGAVLPFFLKTGNRHLVRRRSYGQRPRETPDSRSASSRTQQYLTRLV